MRTTVSFLMLCWIAGCGNGPDWDPPVDLVDARFAADGCGLGGATAAADGGGSEAGRRDQELEPLCDGSAEVRVFYTSMPGELDLTWQFSKPYGSIFLAVDGHCQYFASTDAQPAIVSGSLTEEQASQLGADLRFSQLAAWAAQPRMDETCGSGGYERLGRKAAVETCWCGCDGEAPDRADAFARAYQWAFQLQEQGEPLEGAVSAMALETPYADAHDRILSWPLSRSMSSITNLILPELRPRVGTYARFEAAGDRVALRGLRAAREHGRATSMQVWVSEGETVYDLYVRDELPAGAAASLQLLRQSWPEVERGLW